MLQPQHLSQRNAAAPCRQRGVYALEWALVFIAFFMLLYAIVSFGLAFLVRESMQWAVEDGARAALQFQTSRTARKARALEVVKNNLNWLPAELRGTIDSNFSFSVCELNNGTNCPANLVCDIDRNLPCMVQVQLDLPYAQHPLAASLKIDLMEIVMPDLQARAQIVVDQKGF